ncbi:MULTISPECIES: helix-turn-helix transcriptional regulator [unclassified Streptomyces]|uniref:helix-turn-helix domain-containing protein n=1 Tax=unclassified Streptomyces TaxID=2593676 RepID=UPI0037F3E057
MNIGPGQYPQGDQPPPGKQHPRGTEENAPPLDERQRRLISLLVAGHTDASAAHRLGVSTRTVTNILRLLMDRLGVDNRFQLGVAIGCRMRPRAAPSPPAPRGTTAPSGRRQTPLTAQRSRDR